MNVPLHPTDRKRVLLDLLKRRGSLSLGEAVEATGLAKTTLREHFVGLEGDGLVERASMRQGRGRPALRFRLSERGAGLFPTRDGVLLRELLGYLKREGRGELIEAFFTGFWEARLREAEDRLEAHRHDDVGRRLALLEQLLQEQGFMPDVREEGEEVVIRECNCPFPEAVKRTRLPCRLEAAFFERLLQQPLRRVSYIPDGHAACTYALPAPHAPPPAD